MSSQSRVRLTKPSSHNHRKIFRVRVVSWVGRVRVESQEESSHFETLVCKRVKVKSNEILHFSYVFFCYKMAPNELENGGRKVTKLCPTSSAISGYIDQNFWWNQFPLYFPLSLSVISTSIIQHCWKKYTSMSLTCLKRWPDINMHLNLDAFGSCRILVFGGFGY